MKLHQQNGLRFARQSATHGGRKSRVLHGQVDHGAVNQLHRAECTRCAQLDDVLCGLHGLHKGREVHHAQHFGAGQGAQAQCQRMRQGQGAFAAHQQMGQVDRPVIGIRPFTDRVKNIQVVASHPAQHARPVGIYFGPQVLGQVAHKVADAFSAAMALGHGTPIEQFAIAEPGLGPQNVVHHVAVGDGAAAAGVVARHATQCRLATGGDIHRVPQAVWFEGGVQVVEHDAGLHRDRSLLGIQVQNLPQMLAVVDDQTRAHGLTALTGAAATGYQGHAHATANVQRGHHILAAGGHQDAHGHLLVNRGVGRIAPPVGQTEQHIALGFLHQLLGQPGRLFIAAAGHPFVGVVGGIGAQGAGCGNAHTVWVGAGSTGVTTEAVIYLHNAV